MSVYTVGPVGEANRHSGRYYGKYSGTVMDDDDPDKSGKLKVAIPTVWRGTEPLWARPCFRAGHFPIPEVVSGINAFYLGAKVWVEFEAGDPHYPLWVGVWYPPDTVPDEAKLEPPTSRVVRTPSGHTVEFADKSGEEKIVLRHKLNAFVSIDKKGSVVIGNANGSVVYLNADQGEVSVISEHGHRVVMSADGMALTHHDGSYVDLRADKVTVQASAKVQVMAKEVAVTGGAVSLGAGPTQLNVVLDSPAFKLFAKHVHPSAMGPTGPPTPPLLPMTYTSNSVKASLT